MQSNGPAWCHLREDRSNFAWNSIVNVVFMICLGVLCGCDAPIQTKSNPLPNLQVVDDPTLTLKPTKDAIVAASPSIVELNEVDVGQWVTATFLLKNQGTKPVSLRVASRSCSCARVQLEPSELKPGQISKVILSWVADMDQLALAEQLQVRVSAEVAVNDLRSFHFEAIAHLKPSIRVALPQGRLDFGIINTRDIITGQKQLVFEIYSQAEAKKHFHVQLQSGHAGIVISEPEPLTPERLAALQASSGYRIRIQLNRNMPAGPFREKVTILTSLYKHPLELTVVGLISHGALSLSSEGFNLASTQLSLSRGYRSAPLKLHLRYEPNRMVKVESVSPAFLKVNLIPVKENEWNVVLVMPTKDDPIWQQIRPEQLEEWQKYGFEMGEITCSSDHSDLKHFRIPIIGTRLMP